MAFSLYCPEPPMPAALPLDLLPRAPLHHSFCHELAPGAHLLDAGCGEGQDARHFQQSGYVVSAIEVDITLARRASRHAELPVRVGDISTLHTVVPFDGIWACDLLPHLPACQRALMLTRLAALLKTGGILYCNLPLGERLILPAESDRPEAEARMDADELTLLSARSLHLIRQWQAPLPPEPETRIWRHLLLRKG